MLENTHVSVWLGPHDSVHLIHGGPNPSGERNLKVTLLENTTGNGVFGTEKGMQSCKLSKVQATASHHLKRLTRKPSRLDRLLCHFRTALQTSTFNP